MPLAISIQRAEFSSFSSWAAKPYIPAEIEKNILKIRTIELQFLTHSVKSRVLTCLVYKYMQVFSDCIWRVFLVLMYCDLLTKKWFPNYIVMRVSSDDSTVNSNHIYPELHESAQYLYCLLVYAECGASWISIIQSNLAIRNFLVKLKLFLNAKSSLSSWSKRQIGHGKWFLNTYQFVPYQTVPYCQVWL